MLACAVGTVMLTVCANLSNLLLARTNGAPEGNGRSRRARRWATPSIGQMLTESVLLSASGAAIGGVLAVVATHTIAGLQTVSLPLLGDVRMDASALAFVVSLAMLAGVLFGMAPALQLSELAVHDALKASGRNSTGNRSGRRVRTALVVSEIALACVLLVGSGLLVRSFLKLLDVDLGFRPESVLAIRIDPEQQWLQTQTRFSSYVSEALRLTRALPGVQSAAIADGLPLGKNRTWGVRAQGREYKDNKRPVAFIRLASDGIIDAMGMRLVAGRDIAPMDDSASERVVLINESAARTLWPGEVATGKVLKLDTLRRVVGIVGDSRHLSLDQDAGLELYVPFRQIRDYPIVDLIVRSTRPASSLARSIRIALAPISPKSLSTKPRRSNKWWTGRSLRADSSRCCSARLQASHSCSRCSASTA